MFREELVAATKDFGLSLDDEQLDQFDRFYRLLIDWNSKINLTAITAPKDFAIKHVVDSLTITRLDALDARTLNDGRSVIDVGTGAGFPGIPLKIFYPSLQLTLLDSLEKRLRFLRAAIEELAIEGVACVHSRAEDAARSELRESFDAAVSRAVARLNVLAEYCMPFVAVGGTFVAMKGSSVDEELEEARAAIKILGGEVLGVTTLTLPNGDPRSIVLIKKIRATPKEFPRRAGMPDKKPLSNSLLAGVRRPSKRAVARTELLGEVADLVGEIVDGGAIEL